MRRSGADAAVLVATVLLTSIGVAPTAGAADPGPTSPTSPSSTAPAATSTPAPTTASPPTTRAAATTTTSARSTTTTTTPGAPVTTAAAPEEGPTGTGYATTPAPLIPSASEDPLFHAALSVDSDLRKVSLAKIAYMKAVAATKQARRRARAASRAYAKVRDIDDGASDRVARTRKILRAAALHAYVGYGSDQTPDAAPEVDETDKSLSSRAYVRVTITDATRAVRHARSNRSRTHAHAGKLRAEDRRATAALRQAEASQRAAKSAVTDAEAKVKSDRASLAAQIASMPDLAPGTLDKLPDSVHLPDGATGVQSPVGTIVVPASADPRTVIALQFIVAQIGKPYVWGGTGPNSYDCSGLMLRGFQTAGVRSMPRVSQAQQAWATPVDVKDIQPGDLVFFGRPAYHVGVYIGGGLMIDAPYTGAHVRVDRVWSSVSSYGRAIW